MRVNRSDQGQHQKSLITFGCQTKFRGIQFDGCLLSTDMFGLLDQIRGQVDLVRVDRPDLQFVQDFLAEDMLHQRVSGDELVGAKAVAVD
jgi:hypothetical protein